MNNKPEAFALTWDVALRAGKVYPDHTIKTVMKAGTIVIREKFWKFGSNAPKNSLGRGIYNKNLNSFRGTEVLL